MEYCTKTDIGIGNVNAEFTGPRAATHGDWIFKKKSRRHGDPVGRRVSNLYTFQSEGDAVLKRDMIFFGSPFNW